MLKEWNDYDSMTFERITTLQSERIQKMLSYAQEQVPYYKKLGLKPNSSLQDFPILTKTILREQAEDLISEAFNKQQLDAHHSSGSSGVQSFTYMTKEHTFFLRALQTHMWQWGGYKPGRPLLQTGISPDRGFVKSLKDFFFRVRYMEAFSLSHQDMEMALREMKNIKNKHIAGYPSAINEIAKTALEKNLITSFESIICYGDKLFEHHKNHFNRAFNNPKIVNTYGCAEGLLIACQVDLPYYYIMAPHVYLEIVDDQGNPLEDGTMGHILVTSLTSFGMPLIRYKLGDLGIILPKEKYPSKRRFNYPILQTVVGRETDVIKTPRGDTLVVHSFTGILEYFEEIKQYKIVQVAADRITIEYLTDTEVDISEEVKNKLLSQLDTLTKNSMIYTLKRVAKISASPSGKPQIIEINTF